ncbi:hypothetical protein RJ639_012397 [Escallonia herrerae]|uniref:Exocyst component Exo84 C-terminal domain-containing protein n=1 Tax=Escallonia herrerae TaxID=1293975 RepID=A0AA88VP73_9ASTE|nr:hypothetical protein RJ639_012397 [Escallonia herrerae]
MDTPTSSNPRFRFRDHRKDVEDKESDEEGSTGSDTSSPSSDGGGAEAELDSMTGKGVEHLCSELLELKMASDEEFQKNLEHLIEFTCISRVFEEVEGMENELLQLKNHVSTQKRLVKCLVDCIYTTAHSEEAGECTEEPLPVQPPPSCFLQTHTLEVSEILDNLLLEHRLDEALVILEMEAETIQTMQLQDSRLVDTWISYKSAMSERRTMLADQLALVAENPRVPAAELQKTLVGLCRLGDNNLATQLLLRYYHSRIASGIRYMRFSKSFLYGVYISEVAKFLFSMISQAAKSFKALHGEMSLYASEFIRWASEETEVFATCFNTYVKSISEIPGGLSTTVEAVHFAMSYCSLLETQGIVLLPCLIKHIRPCMEEVLQIHFDHLKKVINILTLNDGWALGRYLVSGILGEESSSMVGENEAEYCLLTNSGRKFVTLLQATAKDISSLVALQMEDSIFKGLMDLLTEYIVILERALPSKTCVEEKGGSRIILAESLAQQVSVLANLSTLVQIFSSIIRNIFKDISHLKFEIDRYTLSTQGACNRLRAHFCEKFIHKIISFEGDYKLAPESRTRDDFKVFSNLMPSPLYQGLFTEVMKLEKLADDNVLELCWLRDLLKELMEAIFGWISTTTSQEDSRDQGSADFMQQSVLDMHFLVEIARHGGYLTDHMINASMDIISAMESAIIATEFDDIRDLNDNGWARVAATKALQKLQEMEKMEVLPDGTTDNLEERSIEYQSLSARYFLDDDETRSFSRDSVESLEDSANIGAYDIAIDKETGLLGEEKLLAGVIDVGAKDGSDDKTVIHSADISLEFRTTEAEKNC